MNVRYSLTADLQLSLLARFVPKAGIANIHLHQSVETVHCNVTLNPVSKSR